MFFDIPIHALKCPRGHLVIIQRPREIPVLRISIYGGNAGFVFNDIVLQTNPGASIYVENGSLAGYNCFHLNALYDLCNKTYVDAIIEPRPLYSEVRSARDMILRQKFDKAILIGDRGYGALNLMEHINRKDGPDYLIRVKEGWITETANLPIQELDTDISFEIRTTATFPGKAAP